MTTQRDHDLVVLITGASSRIGAATTRAMCSAGMTVHATARREQRLHDLAAETGCIPHVLDVCDAAGVKSLIAEIGTVDILVNNAGLGRAWGSLTEATYDDIEVTVSTNVTAAIHMVQVVLPGMIARGSGHIVNVGSMAGLYPLSSALYGATKGAMHRLSTNLRLELQGTGVRVTEICPGRIQTEFYQIAIDDEQARTAVLDTGAAEITAAECADTILYAVNAAPHININRIELQPTEQTYGGSQYALRKNRP